LSANYCGKIFLVLGVAFVIKIIAKIHIIIFGKPTHNQIGGGEMIMGLTILFVLVSTGLGFVFLAICISLGIKIAEKILERR